MFSDLKDIWAMPEFADFWEIWQAAREGGDIPQRRDISLRSLSRHIENMLVYDWDKKSVLSCRIMGGHIQERVKFSDKKTNWMDHIADELVPASKAWWTRLYDQPCAGAMDYSISYLNGHKKLGQGLFLPVRQPNHSIQVYALQFASEIYQVDEPTSRFLIGEDRLKMLFIDIGFGVPDDDDEVVVYRDNYVEPNFSLPL